MIKGNRIECYLDYLYKLDYKERPVDTKTFLCHKEFLGSSLEGGRTVYDIWKRELSYIHSNDNKPLVVLTGAIGTGKTQSAAIGIAYSMHRVLCLKDPWSYFDLSSVGKMTIAFFNLTKTLSHSKGYSLLQSFLTKSPWFINHSTRVGGRGVPYLDFSLFNYVLASPYSKGYATVGEDVLCALIDEMDSPTESQNQKVRILKAYESMFRRFESRFMIDGESIGRFFLVSSKQEEMSFLNTFVEEMKNSKRVYVVDIPLWEAKPQSNYSGDKFFVRLGDAHTPPKVLESENLKEEDIKSGKVVSVPVEYLDSFERDTVGALRDIAGISVSQLRKSKLFSSERFVSQCFDPTKVNPIGTYTINTGLKDSIDYIKYIDIDKIKIKKTVPRYIHCDIAFSGDGDSVGLAMSCVRGWTTRNVQEEEGIYRLQRVPVVETDFAIRIKAPPGDQVPTHKIRKFVLDLRGRGFNIKKFTSDLRLASNDTLQILQSVGMVADYFSLDRDSKAYLDFRDLVLENRWSMYVHDLLNFELVNLEFDRDKQKVDHPDKVKDVVILKDGDVKEIIIAGSKDVADAVVGSVINACRGAVMPADAEVMERLIRKAAAPAAVESNKYWWADLTNESDSKVVVENKMSKKESVTFLNIIKKAKGERDDKDVRYQSGKRDGFGI